MKRLVVTMLTVLTCGAAYALPVGNPSEASLLCDGLVWEGHCGDPCDPCLSWCDAFSFRIGFYGDYVFNRHLEVDKNKVTHHHKDGRKHHHDRDGDIIEHTQIYTNAGYLAANIWDRVDVFATLGATNFFLDTNENSFGLSEPTDTGRIEIETDTRFSWSVGARGTLWECGCTALGLEGQYFRTKPRVRRVSFEANESIYPNHVDARYHEWQVGLGLSHRIHMLVPYVAVKWAGCKWDFDRNTHKVNSEAFDNHFKLKNQKHWGFALGVSLVDCEKAAVTVEGRWADEKALYVNGQIRF